MTSALAVPVYLLCFLYPCWHANSERKILARPFCGQKELLAARRVQTVAPSVECQPRLHSGKVAERERTIELARGESG